MADGTEGQFNSKYPFLSPETAPVADMGDASRILYIREEHFIHTPAMGLALSAFAYALSQPRKRRMNCVYIHGESGTGKTFVIKRFFRDYGIPTEKDGFKVQIAGGNVRAIAVDISGIENEAGFYSEVAKACTPPGATRLNYSPEGVLRMVADLGAILLIVDEADKLAELPSEQQRNIIWQMKYLTNNTQVAIAAVGTRSLGNFIALEDTLAQRFRPPVLLSPLHKIEDLRQFLVLLAKRMPLRNEPEVSTPTFVRKVAEATKGRQPDVCAVIQCAAIHAIREKTERLDMAMLKRAIANPYVHEAGNE